MTPSPLAQGPTDPLIRAYFQIDPAGRVTLPTLPEADLDAAILAKVAAQRAIQRIRALVCNYLNSARNVRTSYAAISIALLAGAPRRPLKSET